VISLETRPDYQKEICVRYSH